MIQFNAKAWVLLVTLTTLLTVWTNISFGQEPVNDARAKRALALQELLSSIEGVSKEPTRTFKTKEGYLRFIGAAPATHFTVEQSNRGIAREAAGAFLEQWRNLLVKESPSVEFSINRINTHESQSYVRHKQMYAGLEVFGAEMIIQVNGQGGIDAVMSDIMHDTEFLDTDKLSFIPGIDALKAQDNAICRYSNCSRRNRPCRYSNGYGF